VRLDLEDFFAAVPAARVYGIFRGAGYPEAVAHSLTGPVHHRGPARGMGRPAPGRANRGPSRATIASGDASRHRTCHRARRRHRRSPPSPPRALDRRLAALAPTLLASYSRYADDLTFSGPADLPAGTLRRVVTGIALEEGFRVAPEKTSVRRRHSRQLVCGVVVNERLNVPRGEYDLLKAILHDAARNGPAAANREGPPRPACPPARPDRLGRLAPPRSRPSPSAALRRDRVVTAASPGRARPTARRRPHAGIGSSASAP
jgi:hypothetical protein